MATNPPETVVNDAHDEPDTGKPPCDFCRRSVPCECGTETCMCTCGRCMAEPLPDYRPLPDDRVYFSNVRDPTTWA